MTNMPKLSECCVLDKIDVNRMSIVLEIKHDGHFDMNNSDRYDNKVDNYFDDKGILYYSQSLEIAELVTISMELGKISSLSKLIGIQLFQSLTNTILI